jgi:hypothetical protein
MADEVTATPVTVAPEATPEATPAAALNTETPAPETPEQTVPYSRFKEINDQLSQLKKAQQTATKAQADAERKAAEESGKFKELYEAEIAKREQAEAQAKAAQLAMLRAKVAKDAGLPDGLASRLLGETEEELAADAKELLKTLPKPTPPNTNSGGGDGRVPGQNPTGLDPAELAAIYGVKPEYLKVS